MGKVYSLKPERRGFDPASRPIHFTRSELNKLLSLYSRRVSRGEWRDYAIDERPGSAAFSVFRRTQERPLFTIAKCLAGPGPKAEFLVIRDHRRLARTARLEDALGLFDTGLRVVS